MEAHMQNFEFHAYTDILFGKGQISKLPEKLSKYGKNVLLVYGGGSIKKNGLYDKIKELLKDFNVVELSGVEPNPKIESVRKGIELCRMNRVEMVLAAGGGSTIDCAKVIAGGYYYDGDAWDIVEDSSKINRVLPVATILTLAATGSEMNKNAVISNMSLNKKLGTSSMRFIPQVSVLDPEYTYGVSKLQTASGTADIMSHVMENYFKSEEDTFVQDRICEGILETCIQYCPIALAEPENYSARANLMWSGTLALNGLCGAGKGEAWSCHAIEHELSAFYDITHGVGLSIITPRWMRHILSDKTLDRFVNFAVNVWHISTKEVLGMQGIGMEPKEIKYALANEGINRLEKFFASCGLPSTLKDVGIDKEKIRIMAEAAVEHGGLENSYVPLNADDVEAILKACL
jgi:alcohol dehydrogenase YqhD (iron-dependent ADH family)